MVGEKGPYHGLNSQSPAPNEGSPCVIYGKQSGIETCLSSGSFVFLSQYYCNIALPYYLSFIDAK